MFEQFLQYADKTICGERIKDWAGKIWRSDRWSKFSRFHQTALMTRQAMGSAGLSDVKIIPLAADGRTRYGDYIIPRAWEPSAGELKIVRPKSTVRLLASYRKTPNSLMMYSAATPPSGLELEIVPWDDMRSICRRQKDSNYFNKLVFTGIRPASIWQKAASRNAAGIIYTNERQEGVHWHNYCFVPRNEERLFGFSLNSADGQWLRNVLRQSARVTAHVRVNTRLFDGKAETVTGMIRGQLMDEILAFAHLYESGAWDNAAGCASLLEISKILCHAIKKRLLPCPKRTIRFMFGWECYSLMAWMLQKKRPRTIAGLTLDGLGRDIIKDNAPLGVHGTPEANPAYTDALLAAITDTYLNGKGRRRMWKMFPFTSGDSLPSDPWFDVPMPYLYQPVPSIWHSSIDTPEQLSADSLKWSAVIGATYLWFLANAGRKEMRWVAEETARHYRKRLVGFKGTDDRLQHLRDCGTKAVGSVSKLAVKKETRCLASWLKRLKRDIQVQYKLEKDRLKLPGHNPKYDHEKKWMTKQQKEAARLVPIRRVPGLLTLQTLPEEAKADCRWGPAYQTLVQPILWTDGERTILDIARKIYFETGKKPDLADLMDIFYFLDKYGYIEFKRK